MPRLTPPEIVGRFRISFTNPGPTRRDTTASQCQYGAPGERFIVDQSAFFDLFTQIWRKVYLAAAVRWLQHFAFLKDLSFQFKAVRREFDASLKYLPPKKNSPLRSVLLFSGFRRRSGGLVLFSLSHQSIPSQIWLISIMVDAFQINYYYLINVVSSRMSKKTVPSHPSPPDQKHYRSYPVIDRSISSFFFESGVSLSPR
jgi:hypothetical protein